MTFIYPITQDFHHTRKGCKIYPHGKDLKQFPLANIIILNLTLERSHINTMSFISHGLMCFCFIRIKAFSLKYISYGFQRISNFKFATDVFLSE